MKQPLAFMLTLILSLSFSACGNGNNNPAGGTNTLPATASGPATTPKSESGYAAFLSLLTENDFPYTENEPDDSFLSVERKPVLIGEEIISVYEYESAEDMEKDAVSISEDGSAIGNTLVDWVSAPRFFKKDTLIIIYVGEEETIANFLKENYGAVFAGYG